ncbi:MAG: DMT family transporter, partial [Nanoarchaeota archaeon]|nr:DMT family transporter [Nanoarchaeota archaeon]
HKEEVSRVIILNIGISPIFVLILSILFLNEILTLKQYIAFALILAGSILISFKRFEENLRLTPGALLALLAGFFFAVQAILLKYLSSINLATIMVYREAGYILSILLVFALSPKARKFTKKVIKDMSLKKTAIVYGAECIGIGGMFLYYLAVQRGPVSLVSVVEGSETIFIFILTIIMSIFLPKILKEEINKKTITIKIISIILTIVGLYLIST